MPIKSILTPVAGTDGDASVLDLALALGQRFAAHISVLHVRGDPRDAVPFLGEGASGALIEQIMSAAQRESVTRAQRAKQGFESWRSGAGIALAAKAGGDTGPSVSWHEETGAEDEWVVKYGRLSDLTVVARPASKDVVASTITFEAALFDTGRPLLLAPPDAGQGKAMTSKPVVIFWNGSSEAARAVGAALPLLAAAPRITAIAANDGGKVTDAHAVVDYLAWHGIKAEVQPPLVITASAGAELLNKARALDAGLVVMGAYTHSRLRQMVFGSVTRHVLENTHIPALMAH